MSSFKSLYHSELSARSKKDDFVKLTIRSGVTASKFRGQPDYVEVFDHEDRAERKLNLENEQIGETLEKWKGEVVLVKSGGRDNDAWIEVEQDDDRRNSSKREEPRRESKRDERPEPRREEREPERRKERETEPRQEQKPPAEPKKLTPEEKAEKERETCNKVHVCGRRMATAQKLLLPSVIEVANEAAEYGVEYTSEDIRTVANTFLMEVMRRIDINSLPLEIPEPKKPKAKQPKEKKETAPVQPEPAPEPPQHLPPARATTSKPAPKQPETDSDLSDDEIPF